MYDISTNPIAVWLQVRIARDERGAGLVEYALLLALIAILCIGALRFLAGNVSSGLSSNTSSMFG
ncbi:MAG: Flp family type IVb pilin [Acidimicrobiia bacterium]